MQDGDTVTYLGLLFGRHDKSAQMIEMLDAKFYNNIVLCH
jgi:hypothetical protein